MGKDKTKDGDAITSTKTNRDHSHDREARDTMLAKTITEAVARETQSIAEVFARQRQRLMCSTKRQSREIMQQPYRLPLKLLLDQMVLESWTPLIGQ